MLKSKLQKTTVAALASAVLSALVLGGCGGGGNAGDSNAAAPTGDAGNTTASNTTTTDGAAGAIEVKSVKVGFTPTIVLPQPLVGTVNGEYAKHISGVTFDQVQYSAGSGVVEALRAGTIDIGCSGPYPAIKAYSKAQDIVFVERRRLGGTAIEVSKDSPIKTVQDLKGKAIGVNQIGSTVDAMVRNVLVEAGLKPDTDVRIIPVEPGDQADALKTGQVAAVSAPAPWPSQVEQDGGRALVDWRKILDDGNYSAGSIFTTKKFADANPNFIKAFIAANKAITDDLNKDRTKGDAQVLAAWSSITKKTLSPEVAKAAFSTIKYTADTDSKNLQRFADIGYSVGVFKKKADLAGFVYTSP